MGFRTGVRFSSGPLENGIVCCKSDIQCRYFMVGCRCEFCKFGFARKRRTEQKSKNAVLIIGGADGSTSFFIVGHSKKQPLKIRIKNSIYRYKCQKERLILQHEPELLGEIKDIPVPDFSNEASVKEYFSKINTRSEMIAEMPDSIIPMDFHLYKIGIDDDFLEMEIDYTWNIFEMSYSGNKKVMKRFKKIARDLYSYYGVTEEDIRNKTKRYSSLVTNLSS